MKKRLAQILLVLISVCVLLFFTAFYEWRDETQAQGIRNFKVEECSDQELSLSWDYPSFFTAEAVRVIITDGEDLSVTETLKPWQNHYTYEADEARDLYQIRVAVIYRNGRTSEETTRYTANEKVLEEMPLLEIETQDGQEPTYTEAERPEGVFGTTLAEHPYVDADMRLSGNDRTEIAGKCEIRYRGNTSITYDKKPYKLKLKKKQDLIENNPAYKDKDWNLLAADSTRVLVGTFCSQYFEMAYTPRILYVNLVMNGDYRGLYIISETVEVSEERVNINKDTGFLIENDAYWWDGSIYFRLENQVYEMAFTFKYPEITDPMDERVDEIRRRIQFIDNAISAQDVNLMEYIDYPSFCRWILIKDVTGSIDAAGANQYYYADSLEDSLKIGPSWDYDGVYGVKDEWSQQHTYTDYTPYSRLFEIPSFREDYIEMWEEKEPGFLDALNEYLDAFEEKYGEGYAASYDMDLVRWNSVSEYSGADQISAARRWFVQRTAWMNAAVEEMEHA